MDNDPSQPVETNQQEQPTQPHEPSEVNSGVDESIAIDNSDQPTEPIIVTPDTDKPTEDESDKEPSKPSDLNDDLNKSEEKDGVDQPTEPIIVTPDTDKPTEDVSSKKSEDSSSNKKTKKSKLLKPIIFIAAILIIAGGISAYFIHKHHENQVKIAQSHIVQHLTIGTEGGDLGSTFYPNGNPDANSVLMYAQVFDGLVQYENQTQIVPDLSSGWTTPNSTTWLFTIKTGIKFHDGHTLTPADVVYSLNLMKKESQTADYAELFATTLKSITAVGTNQVKIVTTQPDPVLLNKLSFMYIVDKNLPKGENGSMAGTGAYELKPGTKLTNTQVQLVAFNGFHGGAISTKEVTMDDVSSYSALVAGYQQHKYDIIGETPDKYLNLPNTYKYDEQDTSVDFLGLNTNTGPLSNKLVREAIRYAVNPNELAQQGPGFKVTPISQLIPPSITGYNPSIMPYQQNIAKSKQLLAQAGYPNGLTLTLNYSPGNSIYKPLVNQLKQVGITINLSSVANLNDLITNFLNGTNQITPLAYSSNTVDGADVIESTMIPSNYANSKLYNLVNQATTTIDPATRLKLLQQAETIIDQNVASIPLFYNVNIYLMNKPYQLHQDLPALFISVYYYKVHLK
jgi:peptide/nickel transport system substrate-binding protein